MNRFCRSSSQSAISADVSLISGVILGPLGVVRDERFARSITDSPDSDKEPDDVLRTATIIAPRERIERDVRDCLERQIGMARMSADEIRAFLAEGTRTGKVATTRADGRPHVAPVWFVLDGDDLVFNTSATSLKGRSLLRDGRVAVAVDDERFPYAFVLVEGPVSISQDLGELRHWATKIAERYVPSDQAEAYGRRNGVPGELLVRLTPVKLTGEKEIAL
jgi:PPOX class probable F420-dependent enzyme